MHHVRQNLPLTDLSLAVQLFAKNIDDESLPSNIQTMSCKLLLNLVDCIRSKSEQENGNGRDILMRMLEVGSTKKIDTGVCFKHNTEDLLTHLASIISHNSGVRAEVSHHCAVPACLHLQEVQTPVRDGRGGPRSITWRTSHTHTIHHSCHSTARSSDACRHCTSAPGHALRQAG